MIVSCGEALIDFMPITVCGVTAYRPFPGGSPFNVAIGIGRLGTPVGFLGRVSTDFFGDMLVDFLKANRGDPRFVSRAANPSTLGFVSNSTDGEPQYAFFSNGAADRALTVADLPPVLDDEVTCLHFGFGAITLMVEPAAATLEALARREAGKRVLALDPNLRANMIGDRDQYRRRMESWVAMCDLVKVSRADLDWLYPGRAVAEAAGAWLQTGPKLVVVTLGAEGAMALNAGGHVTVPGRKVTVVDTVGAGDSFHAALLSGLDDRNLLLRERLGDLSEQELGALLQRAIKAAAITCSRAGANPPTRVELEAC